MALHGSLQHDFKWYKIYTKKYENQFYKLNY